MATFYIEAVENTTITLSKVGSPTVGTAKYGINNTSPSTTYTYGTNIALTAGQKCYWTITSTTTAFSASKYLKFTSTGKINVGGALSDLIGGSSSIPRNYCFYRLFYNCDKLLDASNLEMNITINSKTYCYSYMFSGCTSLTTAPELPATRLANYCYEGMFRECTNIKLSSTQTEGYIIPYRIPSSGNGSSGTNSLRYMFSSTGGTFTGTPTINTTYYLWDDTPIPQIDIPYTVEYNGDTILDTVYTSKDDFINVEYEGSVITTIPKGDERTLKCNGKYMASDITIGNKVLKCGGKIASSDIRIVSGNSITDLTGCTWIANESPESYSVDSGYTSYNVTYTFGKTTSTVTGFIAPFRKYSIYYFFYYFSSSYGLGYCSWNNQKWGAGYPDEGTWSPNQNYNTVTFTGGTDATNADLIEWLQNNGTLVAP